MLLLHRNKAVSDGSVSFYLDRYVRFRVSKFTYGTKGRRRYEPAEYPDHIRRTDRMYTDPTTGFKWLTNGFDPTLRKVVPDSSIPVMNFLLSPHLGGQDLRRERV